MSAPTLTFLYPHLFRPLRVCEPVISQATRLHSRPPHAQCLNKRTITSSRRSQAKFAERRGKGIEPLNPSSDIASEYGHILGEAEQADKTRDAKSKFREAVETEAQRAKLEKAEKDNSLGPLSEETLAAAELPGFDEETGKAIGGNVVRDEGPSPMQLAAQNTQDMVAPLDTILEMPPPESMEEENRQKPPHLQTPPYVHHFDTYTLVKRVEEGGFTDAQAITAMKAVRGLLAENLDVAKEGLVSKSDVENETYLFRAACSELRTEVSNARKVRDETMRRERTLLQHENDILNQKLTQELQVLRDELKGMFDDRKMNVRTGQRAMDSGVSSVQLHYWDPADFFTDSRAELQDHRLTQQR